MKTKTLILTNLMIFLICSMLYAAEPYRVGCMHAITGKASWLGEPQRNTVKMIADEINAAGGINGHKLELFIEDTQGNNTRAVNAAKKLIKKHRVCAIVGPSRSGTSKAVIADVQRAKLPLVSCAAAESMLQPIKDRQWIFKTAQNDSDAIRRIYEHAVKKGYQKIGVITGTTGFGAAGRKLLNAMAKDYGLEVVADETYSPSDTDMTAQLIKIKNAKAQALVNWSIVPAQSIVPQNMQQLKMKITLYQSHGFGNIKYVKAAGSAAEGIIFPGGRLLAVDTLSKDDPQRDLLLKYKKDYEAKFKESVSTFGGHAYDALKLVIQALKNVGDDPAKIRAYLETARMTGTGGIFKLAPADHNGLDKNAFEMLTVKNGKFVVLED